MQASQAGTVSLVQSTSLIILLSAGSPSEANDICMNDCQYEFWR